MPRSTLKFDTATDEGIRSVQKVVPMEFYLAAGVVDGEGKKSHRVIFRPKGTKQFYFLFPKGTEEAMKPTAQWLQDLLERETGITPGEVIPNDPVDVPTGDPMDL
jgi:hypothetical protein